MNEGKCESESPTGALVKEDNNIRLRTWQVTNYVTGEIEIVITEGPDKRLGQDWQNTTHKAAIYAYAFRKYGDQITTRIIDPAGDILEPYESKSFTVSWYIESLDGNNAYCPKSPIVIRF